MISMPFSEGDNLDKSMDKISADMEVADMEKYDKNESFSEVDNLDKSEEVSSTLKEGRHTFRKLAGDFFDNVHLAIFGTMLGRPLLILAVTVIALSLWGVLGYSMGWISFAEVPSEDTVDSVKSIMILICIITIIGRNLRE